MKNDKIWFEEYIQALISNSLKQMINKYQLSKDDCDDIFQSSWVDFKEKTQRTKKIQEMVEYITERLWTDNKFKDEEFKKKCGYISATVATFVWRQTRKILDIKESKYIKNKETWKYEMVLRGEEDKYKINKIAIEDMEQEEYEKDINKEIDLSIFYLEIQKYANILLCLMKEEDIKELKEIQTACYTKKRKFLDMFKNMIINIEIDRKWFDNEEIKEFWIEVLKSIWDREKEENKRFINTVIFKTFKDIYY